jgi:GT2 family glycosyltransferase
MRRVDESVFSGKVFNRLIYGNFIQTSAVMIRKSVVEKIGMFDESLPVAEDYEYWLRISKKLEFDVCKEVLVFYRIGINKDSLCRNVDMMRGCVESILREYATSEKEFKRSMGIHYKIWAGDFYNRSDLRNYRKYFARALLNYPGQMTFGEFGVFCASVFGKKFLEYLFLSKASKKYGQSVG